MSNNILEDVKNHIGANGDNYYDDQILSHVNTVFMIFYQEGIGQQESAFVADENSMWSEFIIDENLQGVKDAMYSRIKMLFDTPQNSNTYEATKNNIDELEWRLNCYSDFINSFEKS